MSDMEERKGDFYPMNIDKNPSKDDNNEKLLPVDNVSQEIPAKAPQTTMFCKQLMMVILCCLILSSTIGGIYQFKYTRTNGAYAKDKEAYIYRPNVDEFELDFNESGIFLNDSTGLTKIKKKKIFIPRKPTTKGVTISTTSCRALKENVQIFIKKLNSKIYELQL